MQNNELYHHGILGMKWGKRNGPPYPLSGSAHSASEKRAGWENSLENSAKKKNRSKSKSNRQLQDNDDTLKRIADETKTKAENEYRSIKNKKYNSIDSDTIQKGRNVARDIILLSSTAKAVIDIYRILTGKYKI